MSELDSKAKEDPVHGNAGTTVVSVGAALSTLGDSAQMINISKIDESSMVTGPQSNNISSLHIHTTALSQEYIQKNPQRIMDIHIDPNGVEKVDSRSITPQAATRQGVVKFLNGGDIDVLEYKINEATNNPVPTDIYTFKKLAN